MELENQEREIQMQNEPIIYASGGEEYYAGNGIEINDENVISIDENVVQEKLTAGENITIDENNVISATGGGGDSNITILTTDDYNYTYNGHDCIAAWLLPAGTYKFSNDLYEEGFEPILLQMHGTPEDDPDEYWVERATSPDREPLLIVQNTDYGDWQEKNYHCIDSYNDIVFMNPINEYGNFEDESVIVLNQPFQGATEDENGRIGLVPMPQMSSQDLFLQASGEWASIPNFRGTDGIEEGKSGAVPIPTVDDVDKYLKSNGAWESLPMFQGTVGGSDGEAGLVPAPTGSDTDKFLKSDGSWSTGPVIKPENYFTANATTTVTGSSLVLADALTAPFKDVKLYGNAEQEGAPTPDDPQTIHVVTGTQTVTIVGKNLFDKDNVQGGNYYVDVNQHKLLASASTYSCYIPIEEGVTYTVSKRVTSRFSIVTTQSLPAAGVTTADEQNNSSANSLTLTASAGAKYLVVYFYREQSETATIAEIEATLQIEKGPLATTYEPYEGNNYSVRLGSLELVKIGDYQDYIYKSDDDWYIKKQVGKVTLTGSESWSVAIGTGRYSFYIRTDSLPNSITDNVSPKICDKFVYINESFSTAPIPCLCENSNLNTILTIFNTDGSQGTDVAAFETWLSTHPTIVYYQFATPTDTKITDADLISDLNALAGGSTYNGLTNIIIMATGTNLPALLKAEYYTQSLAGMSTVLGGKQDELVAGTNITINGNVISSTAPSGPTVVQTIGTSQTDVMSQNATSSMMFDDPSTARTVKIGNDASSGNQGVAIGFKASSVSEGIAMGRSAKSTGTFSSAVGSYSVASRNGEMNIGTGSNTYGYNNTTYRLLGGVHDPIDAHDAATKGYVDAITSYSATEVNTGATWIDGKTIYKKSYSQTITGNSTTFSLGITNLYEIVKMEAIWHAGGTLTNGMPTTTSFPGDSSNNNSITVITYGGTAEINSQGRNGMKGVITFYYTKSS